MSVLSFILGFTKAIAWPTVVAFAIWLFRSAVRRMLENVIPTELDAWGFKTKFARALDKVDELIDPLNSGANLADRTGAESTAFLRAPAVEDQIRSPEWLILNSWNKLEQAARALYKEVSPRAHPSNAQNSSVVIRLMMDLGMTADERAAMIALKTIRNQVAHSSDASAVSIEEALRFKNATESLMTRMRNLAEPSLAS